MTGNGEDIKNALKEFIKNNFLYSSDIESILDEASLIDQGIIDSTGVLELIDFLEEKYEISIENGEVVPENLDSLNNIERFVISKTS